MKKLTFIFLILIIPFLTYGQFEQKIGINISGGVFKTFGKKMGEWSDEYGSKATRKKIYVGKGLKYFSNKKIGELLIYGSIFNVKK